MVGRNNQPPRARSKVKCWDLRQDLHCSSRPRSRGGGACLAEGGENGKRANSDSDGIESNWKLCMAEPSALETAPETARACSHQDLVISRRAAASEREDGTNGKRSCGRTAAFRNVGRKRRSPSNGYRSWTWAWICWHWCKATAPFTLLWLPPNPAATKPCNNGRDFLMKHIKAIVPSDGRSDRLLSCLKTGPLCSRCPLPPKPHAISDKRTDSLPYLVIFVKGW